MNKEKCSLQPKEEIMSNLLTSTFPKNKNFTENPVSLRRTKL